MSVVLLGLISSAWAQRTVSGKVTDAGNREGLPGVAVRVENTQLGAVTDIDGNYRIEVPSDNSVLVFSFIGYADKKETVGNRTTINVQMSEDVETLSEVVVTALGVQREKASLGYAAQSVSGDLLQNAGETNIVNSLAGKVAGVQVTGGSAQGGSSRIILRGINSITGNNQPLFVVDGTPIDNSNYTSAAQEQGGGGYDYGNMASDINPEDIASVTVLKGANAAALYGTRASNGVILITTKKGAAGRKGLGISVNSSATFEDVLVMPKWQNEFGGGYEDVSEFNSAGQRVFYYGADESWGPRLDGRPMRQWYSYFEDDPAFGEETPWVASPDNIDDFYVTGKTFINNIALGGSNETGDFRLSYTNLDQSFILPNGEQKRNTLNFSGTLNLTEKLKASANVNYVNQTAKGRPGTGYDYLNPSNNFGQWFQRQIDFGRLRDNILAPDGSPRTWNIKSPTNTAPNYWDNPYWIRYYNYQNDTRDRLFGNVALTYELFDGVSVTGRVMRDGYTDRRQERIANRSLEPSFYRESIREFGETNMDLILNFNKNITEEFSLTGLIGANRLRQVYNLNNGDTQGGLAVANLFNLENSVDRPLITDFFREREIHSVFGSVSLGYNDFVYVDFTARNDWSSTLPTENNSYFYPSITGSLVFSELIDASWLSFGKLRAGWAQVGSDTDPYRLNTVYANTGNYGSTPLFSVPNTRNNPTLKPEITTSFEVGAEANFFNNRVGFDVTYYNSKSTDQIIPIAVSPTTGFTSVYINAGEITNRGFEALLNVTPVAIENSFRWDVSLNWARNRNEVVDLYTTATDTVDAIRLGSLWGGVIEARKGQPYGAIIGANFQYDDQGRKLVSGTGRYLRTGVDQYLGSTLADWTGGIRNSFTYKGINLSVLIDGQMGGKLFSVTNMFGKYSGLFEETVAGQIREKGMILDGVTTEGAPNERVLHPVAGFASLYGLHAAHTFDATYFKLRDLRLGYTLPSSLLGNLPFRNVTFSLIGRNLAILYKKVPHIDPETTTNAGNVQGLEGGAVPTTRSVGFELRFNL